MSSNVVEYSENVHSSDFLSAAVWSRREFDSHRSTRHDVTSAWNRYLGTRLSTRTVTGCLKSEHWTRLHRVPPKNVQPFYFYFLKNWPILIIFGTLNPEKIWHEHLTDLSTWPVRCSHNGHSVYCSDGLCGSGAWFTKYLTIYHKVISSLS